MREHAIVRFYPLFSGSSGSSSYTGSRDAGILIDVGRSARQIAKVLESYEIPIETVKRIFITHEHTDHVKGPRVFPEKNHISVHTSAGTLLALEEADELIAGMGCCVTEKRGAECAEMTIRPFPISYDCAEGFGYRIRAGDDKIFTLATGLGYISDEIHRGSENSDLVVLGSNHDVEMLQNGPYPCYLERRILSDVGHLSNEICSNTLPRLAETGMTRFILAYPGTENNAPDIAYQTSLCALRMTGMQQQIDFELTVAPRESQTGKILLF